MSTIADKQFQELVAQAQADPAVIGLVLGGSRGKGFQTARSDYDLLLIVRDEAVARYRARYPQQRTAFGDLILLSPDAFAAYAAWGSATHWARYGLARAQVLIDRDGTTGPFVAEKSRVPEEYRLPLVRGALGAYINSIYRSAKCWRAGNQLGARLEAADSLNHLLTILFGLEGRHQPYFGYLERELRAVPLRTCPLPADELLAAIDTILTRGTLSVQQQLLGKVEACCRAAGLGDVFDDHWADDYPWITSFQPE
jgi:hypothetical protein